MPFFSCYRVILWGGRDIGWACHLHVAKGESFTEKLMQHDSVLHRQEDAGTDHAFIRKLPVPPVSWGAIVKQCERLQVALGS
jgi:hypothetical protein